MLIFFMKHAKRHDAIRHNLLRHMRKFHEHKSNESWKVEMKIQNRTLMLQAQKLIPRLIVMLRVILPILMK